MAEVTQFKIFIEWKINICGKENFFYWCLGRYHRGAVLRMPGTSVWSIRSDDYRKNPSCRSCRAV